MDSEIRHILSDLGGVLVHLHYERAIELIRPYCTPPDGCGLAELFQLAHFKADPAFATFEQGALTPRQFFARIRAPLGFEGEFDLFVRAWQSIFEPNMPMIEFMRGLAERYSIYCLSNSNVLHIPYVYDSVPALDFFSGDAISCHLHAAKPDAAYYHKALSKLGLQARHCLFVDDAPENVVGARAHGIRAVQYTDFESARQTILAMLTAGGCPNDGQG